MTTPIIVTARDPETGEEATRTVDPGDYIVIPVEPMYLDGYIQHANGTVVLTLKRRTS